jgi:ribonuclease VapC
MKRGLSDMVVDSSALAAVLFGEEDRTRYMEALSASGRKIISAVNWLEIAMVAEARKGDPGSKALAGLMAVSGLEVIAFDVGQAEIAMDAYRRFGKGRHKAGLNMGDCAAYALAKLTNLPLLFKGGDFPKTDIAEAEPLRHPR